MKKTTVIFAVSVMAAFGLRAERQELSRYQSIIDRQMFGPVPEGFDPTRPPSEVQKSSGRTEKELTKEQEQIRKSVRFSMINLNPAGETMVGFTDSSDPKEVRHYYLTVGEKRDGWEVKAADAAAATVSISKDGVDLDLELGSSSGGGGAASAAGAAGGAAGGGLRRGALANAGGRLSPLGGRSGGLGGLRERRLAKQQQREANEAAAAEDRAKREEEAAAEKARAEEEKAQRDAEREQQRQQLLQIQEELKKAREARQAEAAEAAEKSDGDSSATTEE